MIHFRPVTTMALFRQAWASATIAERINWIFILLATGPWAVVIFLLVVFTMGQVVVLSISEIPALIRGH